MGVEAVPVISLGHWIPSPVGKLEILKNDARVAVFLLAIAPNVKVARAATRLGLARALKPWVLVRGVIDHQLADDGETAPVGFPKKDFEILHRAVIGMDVRVVRNVVAIVPQGRGIKRQEPDGRHAEVAKIVEPFGQSGEVANAVRVAVAKRSDVELVNDRVFVPERVFIERRFFCSLVGSAHVDASSTFYM